MALVKLNDDSIKKLTKVSDYSEEQIQTIINTVAKDTTPIELSYFLSVCKTVGLNPFVKEIWCYKVNTKRGKELLVFAGRDGFLKKAQENPNFNGIRSCEIREKDEFSINPASGEIHHKITSWGDERGIIKGAYAIVFRKNGEPTIEIVDFNRYNKRSNVWLSYPEAMIKKVAEVNALKKAFGISGIQSEHDFDIKNGEAYSIKPKTNLKDDVAFLRGNESENGMSNDEWINVVSNKLFSKSFPETAGEKKKFIDTMHKFDIITGDELKEIKTVI